MAIFPLNMALPEYIQRLREVGQDFKDPKQPGDVFLLRGTDKDGNSVLYRAEVFEKPGNATILSEMTHTEGESGIVNVRLDPTTHLVNSLTSYSVDRIQKQELAIRADGMILAKAYEGRQWRDLTEAEARSLYERGLESAREAVNVVGLQNLLGEDIEVVPQAYQKKFIVFKQF